MEEKLVSVIVAVYNVEKYLENCIASICSQNYQKLQILLVDDGSTDLSGNICDVWEEKDQRITVVHQKNSGVSKARNVGIDRAEGTYIVFVDADDYLEKDYIRCMVEEQKNNGMVITGYFIDIDIERRKRTTPVILKREAHSILDKGRTTELYKAGLLFAVWNKMYCTEILKKQSVWFDENINLGEDALFNLRYFEKVQGKICVINKPLYHYMKRENESLDNKYHPDFFENQIRIFTMFIQYLQGIKATKEDIAEIYAFYFNALVVALDNLYCYRRHMKKEKYQFIFHELGSRTEFDDIVKRLPKSSRWIYRIRLIGIRKGFYRLDYWSRELVKKRKGLK